MKRIQARWCRRVALLACLGCGATSPSGDGDAGGADDVDGSPSGDAASVPDGGDSEVRGECGAPTFTWLPADSMGELAATEPHDDTLTVAEARALSTLLNLQGLSLDRDPEHETQLHRIRYRTQDRGEATEATGMVIVPEVEGPQALPVLLFLHGTTGVNDACSPSSGLDDSDSENFQAALLLSLFASYGYVIVAPDYIGLRSSGEPSAELHPYLIGEPTAIASLDAVRAAARLVEALDAGVSLGPVAVWGASQGGHAAAFTVVHAAGYAPDVPITAAVYGVPPLDLAAHWRRGLAELRSSTGFFVMAFAAMAPWYALDGLADVFVSPYDVAIPEALATECSPSTLDGTTSLEEVFTAEILAVAPQLGLDGDSPWSCIAAANSVAPDHAARLAAVPSLIVVGELDTIVDPAIERATFERLCDAGVPWSFLECAGAGHTEGFLWSIDDALDFIDARFAGAPVADACVLAAARECQNQP